MDVFIPDKQCSLSYSKTKILLDVLSRFCLDFSPWLIHHLSRVSSVLFLPSENRSTLWQSNMEMESGPLISDSPIKTSVHRGFSIAMFDYQRVITRAFTMKNDEKCCSLEGLAFPPSNSPFCSSIPDDPARVCQCLSIFRSYPRILLLSSV